MLSFLPKKYMLYINELDLSKLYEIRLRENYCVKIKLDWKVTELGGGQVVCSKNDIDEILKNVTEYSLYAFNESLKKGFLTTKNGVRIGIAGECVYDNGKIITIKNITSLNIRVPHLIENCAKELYDYVFDKQIYNSLIISPPFYGKTTILKDLVVKLNLQKKYNILVVDERNEFCFVNGEYIDSIKYCDKSYAFSYGIRSMSPDVIITDELAGEDDWRSVEKAIYSGVKVIASCHGDNIAHVKSKNTFIGGIFDRYIILDSQSGQAGKIKEIFDGKYRVI